MSAEIINMNGHSGGGNGEEPPPDFLHMKPKDLALKIQSISPEELTRIAHALATVVLKEDDTDKRKALYALHQVVIDEHKLRRERREKGITPAAQSLGQEARKDQDEEILRGTITAIRRLLGNVSDPHDFRVSLVQALIDRKVDPVEANASATRAEYAIGLLENGTVIHDVHMRKQRIEGSVQKMKDILEIISASPSPVQSTNEEVGEHVPPDAVDGVPDDHNVANLYPHAEAMQRDIDAAGWGTSHDAPPTLLSLRNEHADDRRERKLDAGRTLMTQNSHFERALRSARWDDTRVEDFTAALGARKLCLDMLLFRVEEIKKGIVWTHSKKELEVLRNGLKVIRAYEHAFQRVEKGRARMSNAENETLHTAVTQGTITEADARDYAAMRAGWFGGVGLTARRRELNLLVRPILAPVWVGQNEYATEQVRQRLHTARVDAGNFSLRDKLRRKKPDVLIIPEFSVTNRNRIMMAQARGDISREAMDSFLAMWSRHDNKGVITTDEERAAVAEVNKVLS